MLTYTQRHKLPDVAAQVARRFPGATFTEHEGRAVLTVDEGVTAGARAEICRFVYAAGFADFTLAGPDDPPPAPATEEWLAENQRGSRLDSTLTTFSFR